MKKLTSLLAIILIPTILVGCSLPGLNTSEEGTAGSDQQATLPQEIQNISPEDIPVIVTNREYDYVTRDSEETFETLATLSCDTLSLYNEGFDELRYNIEMDNSKALDAMVKFKADAEEAIPDILKTAPEPSKDAQDVPAEAPEAPADTPEPSLDAPEDAPAEPQEPTQDAPAETPADTPEPAFTPWSFDSRVELTRADEKVVSYLRIYYSYSGGEFPNVYMESLTCNTTDGSPLEIEDIVIDKEAFLEALIERLSQHDYHEHFHEDWADRVATFSNMSYALTTSGLEVNINPLAIAPIELGLISIEFTYENDRNLFNEDILPSSEQSVFIIPTGSSGVPTISYDLNGDGTVETLSIFTTQTKDGIDGELETSIFYYQGEMPDESSEYKKSLELGLGDCYIMQAVDGKMYLYLEERGYNDYCVLHIFDLSDPSAGVKEVEFIQDSFYGIKPLDARCIILSDRINIMGTYSGFRRFYIGEGGLPVPYDVDYQIINGSDRTMTLKKPFEDTPAGTELIPYKTDGRSYMVFKLNGNELLTLNYDDFTSWPKTINDMEEEELLDGIMYAG